MQSNHVDISLKTETEITPRVMQISGMFDVSVNEKTHEHGIMNCP